MDLISYLSKVFVYTALFWATYRVFFSGNGLHRFNRVYLLLAMVIPLILPFVSIPTAPLSTNNLLVKNLPEFIVGGKAQIAPSASETTNWLVLAYLAVAALLLGRLLINHISFRRKLQKYPYLQEVDYQLFEGTGMGPGSYGRKVFMPGNADEQILAHELAHICFGHRYDLLFIQVLKVVFWPNIFLYFLAKEIKLVHEYQADALAASNNTTNYISAMLGEIFGTQYPTLSHSFFHQPIKNRIRMLQKQSSFRKRWIGVTTGLFTVILLITGATWLQSCNKQNEEPKSGDIMKAVPKGRISVRRVSSKVFEFTDASRRTGTFIGNTEEDTEEMIARIQSGKNTTINNTTKNGYRRPDKNGVYSYVGDMPEFSNGDVSEWLSKNIVYPVEARNKKQQGRAIITFVVSETGKIEKVAVGKSSGFTELDKEAVRVVQLMPDWRPGTNEGIPVKVSFSLPITYKID